jgi:N-acetylmuramoyl-L-alanine amidase
MVARDRSTSSGSCFNDPDLFGPEHVMKICIDPGHGMSNRRTGIFDPGCTHVEDGFTFREADIVLKYGLTLKDVLRARSIEVFMTRDDDTDHAPVGKRATNALNAGCQQFISIHVNDADSDSANGFEVLYGATKQKPFATTMQEALLPILQLKDRNTVLRTDLAVLKFTGPALLIELGFIAFDKDRETMLNPQIRERVCKTIADVLQA